MPKYVVPMTTYANIAVTVEVPDDVTDPQAIADLALIQIGVSLCNHCSGMSNDSLELGDDWAPIPTSDTDPTPLITRDDA